MKKITSILIFTLLFSLFSNNVFAQFGYTYTFLDNGNYSYSIAAVPDASASNFPSSVQSYGFTVIVPDGVTISITSSFGGAAGATFFNGNDVGMPTIDGYLITETLNSPLDLPAPNTATVTPMVTIQVNGSPTSGDIYVLANNSGLATTITPLKSFMQADMEDDSSANYSNRIDPNGTGLSGTTSYNFSTLSTEASVLAGYSIFPNPASDVVYIKGLEQDLKSIEVFNVAGQKVLTSYNNLESINIRPFDAGVYIVKLSTETEQKLIKLVKKK
jgi:hypothetical protein